MHINFMNPHNPLSFGEIHCYCSVLQNNKITEYRHRNSSVSPKTDACLQRRYAYVNRLREWRAGYEISNCYTAFQL